MRALKVVAILLIVAGIFGLVYGKPAYTKWSTESHGTLLTQTTRETSREQKSIDIPLWLSIAAVVAGGVLLFVPKRS